MLGVRRQMCHAMASEARLLQKHEPIRLNQLPNCRVAKLPSCDASHGLGARFPSYSVLCTARQGPAAVRLQPPASKALIERATCISGMTSSTAPNAIASLGMPKTTQLASS